MWDQQQTTSMKLRVGNGGESKLDFGIMWSIEIEGEFEKTN